MPSCIQQSVRDQGDGRYKMPRLSVWRADYARTCALVLGCSHELSPHSLHDHGQRHRHVVLSVSLQANEEIAGATRQAP
jgi:hypothetical protein